MLYTLTHFFDFIVLWLLGAVLAIALGWHVWNTAADLNAQLQLKSIKDTARIEMSSHLR